MLLTPLELAQAWHRLKTSLLTLQTEIIAAMNAEQEHQDLQSAVKCKRSSDNNTYLGDAAVLILPLLSSALQRILKQLVTLFDQMKLSEHKAITVFTVGKAGQRALSQCIHIIN